MKRFIKPIVIGVFAFVLIVGTPVKALTIQELQTQIQALLAQISALQQQLVQMQGNQGVAWCHTFSNNLKIGDGGEGNSYSGIGAEIYALIQALSKDGILDYSQFIGEASAGSSLKASYFGEDVASYVVEFQEKYASEILAPYGLKHGTGYVGVSTRAKLNKLYGCNNQPVQPTCQNLWWYDNSNRVCSQKQFCGVYMYLGLKTFSTQSACDADLGNIQGFGVFSGSSRVTALKIGSSYTLKWNSTPFNSNRNPSVYIRNITAGTTCLAGAVQNTGSYTFTLPERANVGNCNGTIIPGNIYQVSLGNDKSYVVSEDLSVSSSTTQLSITVTSPINGDNLQIGKTYTIKWQSSGYETGYYSAVYLVNNKMRQQTKINDLDNVSGSFNWNVPTTISDPNFSYGPGDVYSIKVTINKIGQGEIASGVSVGNFNIIATTQPSITVNKTTCTIGQICNITWTSSRVNMVNIGLLVPPSTQVPVANNILASNSSYVWTVPNSYVAGSHYSINISSSDGSVAANNDLTLIAAAENACTDSDGGLNYSTYGNVKVGESISVDKCWGNELWEYYCNNGAGDWKGYVCPNGCENGACKQAVAQPSVTVTSPNGGETWVIGTNQKITWSAQNIPSNAVIDIDIYAGTCVLTNPNNRIATGLSVGTTSYNWLVSGWNNSWGIGEEPSLIKKIVELFIPEVNAAGGYAIGIRARVGNTEIAHGCSSQAFFITDSGSTTQPSITVTSPNGGESLSLNQNYKIAWTSQNIYLRVNVLLIAYDQSGSQVGNPKYIANGIDNVEYYYWIPMSDFVGTTSGIKYKIKITEANTGGTNDISDNYFTIAAAACTDTDGKNQYVFGKIKSASGAETPDTCVYNDDGSVRGVREYYCVGNQPGSEIFACPNGCENGACKQVPSASITVLSPNGGEAWNIGEAHSITWSSSGLPASALLSIGINGDGQTSTMSGGQIATNISASLGSYSWTIPAFLGESLAGKKYSVYATCLNCSGNVGYASQNYFSIAAAPTTQTEKIIMFSPVGGENWKLGSAYNINWSMTTGIEKVNVALIYDGAGAPVYHVIAKDLYSFERPHSWTIPASQIPANINHFKVWIGTYDIPVQGGIWGDWNTIKASAYAKPYSESGYFTISATTVGYQDIEDQLASISQSISNLLKTLGF